MRSYRPPWALNDLLRPFSLKQLQGHARFALSQRLSCLPQVTDYEQNIAGLRGTFDDYSRDLHRYQGDDEKTVIRTAYGRNGKMYPAAACPALPLSQQQFLVALRHAFDINAAGC